MTDYYERATKKCDAAGQQDMWKYTRVLIGLVYAILAVAKELGQIAYEIQRKRVI